MYPTQLDLHHIRRTKSNGMYKNGCRRNSEVRYDEISGEAEICTTNLFSGTEMYRLSWFCSERCDCGGEEPRGFDVLKRNSTKKER